MLMVDHSIHHISLQPDDVQPDVGEAQRFMIREQGCLEALPAYKALMKLTLFVLY